MELKRIINLGWLKLGGIWKGFFEGTFELKPSKEKELAIQRGVEKYFKQSIRAVLFI